LLEVLTEGGDALFIAKTYSFWELTFARFSKSIDSSVDSSSIDSDSDLTDTSELTQPLAEQNCCELSIFFRNGQ